MKGRESTTQQTVQAIVNQEIVNQALGTAQQLIHVKTVTDGLEQGSQDPCREASEKANEWLLG
jgi:hypothetical protein